MSESKKNAGLRDHIACEVLKIKLLAAATNKELDNTRAAFAQEAYAMADAMMKERSV